MVLSLLILSEHLTLQVKQVKFVFNKLLAYNLKGKPLIVKLQIVATWIKE